MRAVFRILRLALGGEGRLGEVAGEQQSRQQEAIYLKRMRHDLLISQKMRGEENAP